MRKLRIAITGATGLLGRNLLFEILKQNLSCLDRLEILVLGRPRNNTPTEKRLEEELLCDGSYYLGSDPAHAGALLAQINDCILPISFDLTKDDLGISPAGLTALTSSPIDRFYHVAALTDFRSGREVEQNLRRVNVEGTGRICKLFERMRISEAIYVGSAFSCGDSKKRVLPDDIDLNSAFRNPYERSKLEAEILFRDACKKLRLKFRVFRPTGICGRLIEAPIGSVSKYDLFYGWAIFFIKHKLNSGIAPGDLFKKDLSVPIRIAVNADYGMNLVPADYSAKLICAVSAKDHPDSSFHISNPTVINNKVFIETLLGFLGVSGYSLVKAEPDRKSEIERLYYRTVGKIFTPYIEFDQSIFDIENTRILHNGVELKYPEMSADDLVGLLEFAKENRFGLKY